MASPYYRTQDGPVIVQGHVIESLPTAKYQTGQVASEGTSGAFLSDWNFNDSNSQVYKGEAQPTRCNDVFFGILFYAHLAVIAWATIAYLPQMYNMVSDEYSYNSEGGGGRLLQDNNAQGESNSEEESNVSSLNQIYIYLCVSGVAGVILCSLALSFMMVFAGALIKTALWFNIIVAGILAVLSLLSGVIPMAIMFSFAFGLSCYYTYVVWRRIPFAAANMTTAITAVRANIGVTLFAYFSLILTFLWSTWWSLSFLSTTFVVSGCNLEGACETEPNGLLVFAFLVSYYWTAQVIRNVVHVTVAGTVGTWWFVPQEASSCCSKAVTDSWFRAMTYSFGSICLGSLVVAIIQAVKEFVHQLREQNDSMLASCAECLIGCVQQLVEYFNQWAYVYVGLYGYSFLDAGKNVMNIFKSRGWTAIIADMLVDSVLSMVAIAIGVLTGVALLLVSYCIGIDLNYGNWAVPLILGSIFGFVLAVTLFSVVGSAVNTVIVCYAEAPAEFQMNHPKLSEEMRASWLRAWPNDFSY
jgi:Plasma-membrane choline transporter